MASPQEVLEIAIPHLPDVTPEVRRVVAKQVIEALQVNEYYFVRRQLPVTDSDDGQCSKCKCELVHIMSRPAFQNAEDRIQSQQRRITKLEDSMREIAIRVPACRDLIHKALY